MIYLALYTDEIKRVGIKKISDDLRIPSPFLGKILQTLAKKKVLISTKGPNGGFGIAEKYRNISLYEIIKIIDGDDLFDRCLITDKTCTDLTGNPCAIHEHYKEIRASMTKMFSEYTISKLAREFKKSGGTIDL